MLKSLFKPACLSGGVLFAALSSAYAVPFYQEAGSGMSLQMEVYTYQPDSFQLKRVARLSLVEDPDVRYLEGKPWLVRPIKNPPGPLTRTEIEALVKWVKRQETNGLVLDGRPEIGDRELELLQPLYRLSLLSLRSTQITDQSVKTIGRLKNLRYLDLRNTAVTPQGIAALPESLTALPSGWSSAWTLPAAPQPAVPNPVTPEPAGPASGSYFLGHSPQDGLRGQLPRGKYRIDYSLHLKTLEGQTITLGSQKGKVMFLNFWATWCGPCRAELPSLESLYQILKDEKVFFAYVVAQPAAEIKAFLTQNRRNLPVYIVDQKDFAAYMAGGVPTTVIISKQGDWVVQKAGAAQWDAPEVVEYLFKLIKE